MQQEIYKTHSGEVLAITELQARVLKNKTNWKILFDKEWESLLSKIKECDIQVLQIMGPQELTMFSCIQSIKFGQLVQLNLSNIELCTTEPILSMKTPRLQYLRLNNNKLSNVKALRKMGFPQLKELTLYNNRIVDASPLVQIHSRSSLQIVLFRLHKKPMTYVKDFYETNDIEDYSCMFKLKKNVELVIKPYIKCLNKQKIGAMLIQKFMP